MNNDVIVKFVDNMIILILEDSFFRIIRVDYNVYTVSKHKYSNHIEEFLGEFEGDIVQLVRWLDSIYN